MDPKTLRRPAVVPVVFGLYSYFKRTLIPTMREPSCLSARELHLIAIYCHIHMRTLTAASCTICQTPREKHPHPRQQKSAHNLCFALARLANKRGILKVRLRPFCRDGANGILAYLSLKVKCFFPSEFLCYPRVY